MDHSADFHFGSLALSTIYQSCLAIAFRGLGVEVCWGRTRKFCAWLTALGHVNKLRWQMFPETVRANLHDKKGKWSSAGNSFVLHLTNALSQLRLQAEAEAEAEADISTEFGSLARFVLQVFWFMCGQIEVYINRSCQVDNFIVMPARTRMRAWATHELANNLA